MDVEFFINSIQERPILWDKRNKNYHNRLLSYREWENFAKITGTTSEIAKKKWKNLRDTFMKELKKIPKPRSGADAENEPKYMGTWPYFENMSFLTVILKPRITEGNIIPEYYSTDGNSTDLSESTTVACLEEVLGVDVADNDNTQLNESASILREIPQNTSIDINPRRAPSPSPSLPAITRQTRKRKDTGLEAFLDIEREKIQFLRQDQQDNADWFRSILPYMKQLPALNKLHFRTQMQELLLTELAKLNPPQSMVLNMDITLLCEIIEILILL